MPQYTPNLQLYKWDKTDSKVDTITEMASNAHKIDTKLKDVDESIAQINTDLTTTTATANDAVQKIEQVQIESAQAVTTSNEAQGIAESANTKSDEAKTLATDAKNTANTVKTQLDEVTKASTIDPQVSQALVGSDGKTYANIANRFDTVDALMAQNTQRQANAWVDVVVDFDASPFKTATENTTAIQGAIDYVEAQGGGIIWIPYGKFNHNGLQIKNPNVKVWGVGTLNNGKLTIGDNTVIKDLYFEISGINIEYDSIGTGNNGIEIQNARVGTISCKFKNVDKAIYIKPVSTMSNQHTNKITIEKCAFNNTNYNLYIDRYADNGVWAVGDISFINNNPCRAFVTHIYGLNVDGFTSGGNVYFFPSFNDKNQTKKQNIYLDFVNWVTIGNGDKLFEAGEEAILIKRFENVNIVGANIAWCGQKTISSGIRFDVGGRDVSTVRRGIFNIKSNVITMPTKHGIELNDEVGFGTVSGNTVREAGSSSFYYGDGVKDSTTLQTELNAITHYGIFTNTATSYIEVTGNQTGSNINLIQGIETHFSNNMETGRKVPQQNRIYQHYNGSTIDVASYETVQLRSTSAVTITDITGGYNGMTLTLFAYNGNTTLAHNNAKIRLKGDVNTTLPSGNATLTLKLNGTVWYEIGRNF